MKTKFEVIVGYQCNYRCKYCFEQYVDWAYSNKRMDEDVLNRTATYIKRYYEQLSANDSINVGFYGGENL